MGILVPVNNPEKLAEAIELYLGKPDLAKTCSEALYHHVLAFHDVKKVCKAYMDVYNIGYKTM